MKQALASRRAHPRAALLAALALPAVASAAPEANVPRSALHACAVIAAASERLSCYDQLAGREAQSITAGSASVAAATPASAPSPPATAVAAAPAVSTAPGAPPQESFGLYTAEHPAAPLAQSLRSRVISVGGGARGRMTVELEGGQLWELEDADPLLAAGDTVSISRASLGSFLLETPTRRTHRARRLH